MAEHHPPLRFDHREIAVIFSLFIFVSLLMFTVGIVVGKGLAQTKYEKLILDAHSMGQATRGPASPEEEENEPSAVPIEAAGTMVKSDTPTEPAQVAEKNPVDRTPDSKAAESPSPKGETPKAEEVKKPEEAKKEEPIKAEGKDANPSVSPSPAAGPSPNPAADAKSQPKPEAKADDETVKKNASIELVPKAAGKEPAHTLKEPESIVESQHLLKDPRIMALLEPGSGVPDKTPKRKVSSLSDPFPKSLSSGDYTVQVGSYPTKKEAVERVEDLKKLGFPYSYVSVKKFGDEKEIWYRVWLGYFSTNKEAQKSGELLQKRGEIKNFLVRKTEDEITTTTAKPQ